MKKYILSLITSLFIYHVASAQSTPLQVVWDDGLKLESKDGDYEFSIGGRVHYDAVFLKQSAALDTLFERVGDNIQVRRARISFKGKVNKAFAYEFEFTFGEEIKYGDMYLAFLHVPVVEAITVGHFREPFGLEESTSSNAIVFMERSLTSAFGPSRNTGIMLQKEFLDKKLRGYVGVFRITDDLGADIKSKGKHSFSSRWVYVPVNEESTNETLHIGAAVNLFRPEDYEYKLRSRNESHISPYYINTGKIEDINQVKQLGGELGYSKNKWLFQSEYMHAIAARKEPQVTTLPKTIGYSSYYVMASYFIKGGRRSYDKGDNRFSSISLTERSDKKDIKGAWEVGLRFSHIDIANSGKEINNMSDATLGLNWYFNSNSRIMMNYVLTHLNQHYNARSLQFRIQVTF